MSIVLLKPPCRTCGSLNTTRVAKNCWLCLGCKRQFESPPEPSRKELELALVLNKKRREHASYYGQRDNLLLEKTRLMELVQKHLDRISHLEGVNLFADEIMDECLANEKDLLSQIATLEQREREQRVMVSVTKQGKLKIVKEPKLSKEAQCVAEMTAMLELEQKLTSAITGKDQNATS
jgi:hypothetical protein